MANLNDVIIRIDPIKLSTGTTYTHSSTSYIVSKNSDFTDIVLTKDKDTVNLTELIIPYTTLGKYNNLYVKVKIWFSNNTNLPWTIVDINTDQSEISFSDNMVVTPTVTMGASNQQRGKCIIKPSSFKMYHGTGNHMATSYRIETLNGDIVFEKLVEKANKDYLPICKTDLQTLVNKDGIYVIKVKHHTDTDTESHWGTDVVTIGEKYIVDHKI